VLAKFDLRFPDIKVSPDNTSSPDTFSGEYKLPLDEFIDYKKMGMK
jgi:hypothetical protein